MAIFAKDANDLSQLATQASNSIDRQRETFFKERQEGERQKAKFKQESDMKEADFQNEGRGQQRNLEQLAQLIGKNPKAGYGVNNSGVSYNPQDPLASLLRMEARDDSDLVKYGTRLQQSNVPQANAAMLELEQGTASVDAQGNPVGGILTNPNYEMKSTGPIANMLPQFVKNIGEKIGLMPEGAAKEAALLQRPINVDIKDMSGASVSGQEQARQNIEKGLSAFGDPSLVKTGIQSLQKATEGTQQNINSSTRPEIVSKYRQQGGPRSLQEQLGVQQPAQGNDPAARLQMLRNKYRGR